MKSFLKNSSFQLKLGLSLLAIIFIFAFILPLFNSEDPGDWNTYTKYIKPNAEHILGTNALGQDIFWLLAKATQNSLLIGLVVAFFATLIAVILGMIAGFRGGFVDRIISLFADTFIIIPSLPILILLGSLYKGRASVAVIAAIIVLFSWSWRARQIRSMALSLRERDFIDTARFSGMNQMKIIVRECMPFVVSFAMAGFINTILVAIRTESTLAIIGMSNNSWTTLGTMIYWANQYSAMLQQRWLWIGAPVVATVVVFVALFMTLSGVQKYNARMRGKEV